MSIWPPVFQQVVHPSKAAVEQLVREKFGVDTNDRNCPEPVMRWAVFAFLRLLNEGGKARTNAKLEAQIARAAADFKREAS